MAAPRNDPGFGGGGTGIVQNGGLTTTTSGTASTTVPTSQTDGTVGVETAVYNTYGRSQIMVFTDVISEGPIEGLVNEGQSILLNGDPLVDSNETILRPTGTFGFTSSSSTVTVPSGTTVTLNTADKYIIAKAAFSATGSPGATISAATTETSLNITSTVFNSQTAWLASASTVPTVVRLADQTTGEIYFEGKIESISSGSAVCSPIFNSTSNIDYTATYDIYIDRSFKITAVDTAASPDELTISPAADFSGSKLCIVTASIYDENTPSWAELFRYDAGSYLFKTGEAPWGAMGGLADSGIGSQTGIVVSNSHPIEGPTGTGGADNFQEFTLSTLSGLSASLAPQIDELKILFNYSSMYSISTTTGNEYSNGAKYKVEVDRKIGGSFQGYETVTNKLMHIAFSKSAITFEYKLPLEVYQPFQDLKVKITRLTEDEAAYENLKDLTTVDDTGYNANTKCSIGAITAIIKEPLVYPYTALGRVTVSTKQFSNPPKRTYHCKGLKVQIPSNYDPVNRTYTGNWDGSFDSTKQYTNNPAWVFYDMLTSKRYGLGNWLLPADIDKWSLYRIAKYCDELVPDGSGSTEPRFTANLYITKSTDAYKLLKDMATIFRGILFWMDGLVTPVMDASGDAIANFSASNVIDGDFKYESTGNRTRSNQIIVSWNNPLNGYKQEALIVEDVENIIKTGKVIAEEAVAFGCTSEGQALRYGRWKLWTAINQTEIVNFQTGINGAFLKPGDLINVQDPNRYPQAVRYGGRVSSGSPSGTTTVNLDSEVTLNSGSSYELSVLLPTAGAYLNEDSFGGYSRGDNIPASAFAGGVINEQTVANYGGQVIWSEHSHTETLSVSNSPGTTDTITVTGAFSSAPDAQSAWVLRETSGGYSTYGSAKLYRVLGITEDEPNLYTVNAVEHYNEKFDSVDSDFTLSIQDPVYPRGGTDLPPPPRNFVASVLNEDGGPYSNDILLTWDKPLNDDGSIYSKQSGYLIEGRSLDGSVVGYDVAGPNETRKGPYYNLGNGEYRLSIRTQADGKQSDPVIDYISVGPGVAEDVTRYWGIPLGGTLNTTASISSAGEFSFGSYNYRLLTSGAPTISREFSTISPNDTYVQDCSGISADYFPSKSFNQQKVDSYYIFFDASESTLKLVKRYNIPGTDLGYVYDAGNGSNSETTYWTSSSGGTITISSGSTLVTGSGTSFTTDFQIGDLIRIDGPSPDLYAVVDNIQSDTVLYLDRVFDTAISSSSYSIPGLRIDRNNDALLGYVRNESDISPAGSPSTFNFYPLNLITEGVNGADSKTVRLYADDYSVVYDTTTSPDTIYISNGTSPPSITITADSQNFIDPVYRITANNYVYLDWSAGSPDASSVSISDLVPASIAAWNTAFYQSNPVVVTVEVAEAAGGSPYTVEATDSISLFAVAEGVDGTDGIDGYTVINTNSTHNIPTSVTGALDNTNTGTTFEVFKGATELNSVAGSPVGIGEYSITTATTGGISVGSTDITGNSYIFNDHTVSGITGNTASITYTFNLEGIATGTQKQTFTVGNYAHDALRVELTVPSKSLYTNTSGTVTLTGSGTEIRVYEGDTLLNYTPPGTGLGTWTIGTRTQSPTSTVTLGAVTDPSPDLYAVIGDISAWGGASETVTITYPISGKRQDGTSFTLNATQNLSKSIQGATGATGADGIPGNVVVYLYQTNTGASPPAPDNPGGNSTYNFEDGTISVGSPTNGWVASPPSINSSDKYLYRIEAVAKGSEATGSPLEDTIASGEWTDPILVAIYAEDGAPGSNGLRTVQGYLYYEKTTAGTPLSPSGNTYTFNTGLVSGIGINDAGTTNVWKNSPNVQDPTSTNTHYIVRYYGTETAAGANTIAVTYSTTVSQHTNFDSVVTFNGGTGSFYEGATEITTIDGGNITTGTITLDTLNSTAAYSAGSDGVWHTFSLDATGSSTFFDGLLDSVAFFGSRDVDIDGDGSVLCSSLYLENLAGDSVARDSWAQVIASQWGAGAISMCDSDLYWGSLSDSWLAFTDSQFSLETGGNTFAYSGAGWKPTSTSPAAWGANITYTISGADISPVDFFFSNDGKKLYILGDNDNDIQQFSLTTAFAVNTASSDGTFSILKDNGSPITSPVAMFISQDGIYLYVADDTTIYQYRLTVPWDITASPQATLITSKSGFTTGIRSIYLDPAGSRLYIGRDTSISEHLLTTGHNISTTNMSVNTTFSPTGTISLQSFTFKPSGDYIYIYNSNAGDDVRTYRVNNSWKLSSASSAELYTLEMADSGSPDGSGTPKAIRFDTSGNNLYLLTDVGSPSAAIWKIYENATDSFSAGSDTTFSYSLETSKRGFADRLGEAITVYNGANYANGYITQCNESTVKARISSTNVATLPKGSIIAHPNSRTFGIEPNGLITGRGSSWLRLNDIHADLTTPSTVYANIISAGRKFETESTDNIDFDAGSQTFAINDNLSSYSSVLVGALAQIDGNKDGIDYCAAGKITAVGSSSPYTITINILGHNKDSGGAIAPDGSWRVRAFPEQFKVTHEGQVYINNTTASTNAASGALIVDGGVGVAGDIYADGDIVAIASSDARLKDNLQVIPNALTKVDSISGYTFEWNEKSNKKGTSVGVVAQEIQEVLPEVVVEKGNGYLGVEYEKIIPLLIEAIKELKKEVEELKNGNS